MKSFIKIIFTLLTIIVLNACHSNYSPNGLEPTNHLSELELKQQLLDTECFNAAEYLNGSIKYIPKYKNFLSSKVKALKLACVIKNKATLATVKDIRVSVMFKSKTGALILEEEFEIYEFIAPNNSFKYKTEIPITNQQFKDIANFEWIILEAKCK